MAPKSRVGRAQPEKKPGPIQGIKAKLGLGVPRENAPPEQQAVPAPLPKGPVLHQNLPIIETADKMLLDILLADKDLGQHVVLRLTDCVAVISPTRIDVVIGRLRKLGHLPKVVWEQE